jgi:hypothetical protein
MLAEDRTIRWRGKSPKTTLPVDFPVRVDVATSLNADPSTTHVGPTVTIVPPTPQMQAGDLVVVHCFYRGTNVTWGVSTTGGQQWDKCANHTGTNLTLAVFFCRYTGAWAANPIFTIGSGAETAIAVMSVFRPTNPRFRWALDQAPSLGSGAGTAFTITGITPQSQKTVAIAAVCSIDDNTYTLTTGRWTNLGLAQYRSTGGTDGAMALAYIAQNELTATGSVTLTQATLGADAGLTMIVVFKQGEDFQVGQVSRSVNPQRSGPNRRARVRRLIAISEPEAAGGNDMSASGSLTISGTADLDATGSLSAAGLLQINGVAALNGAGNLSAAGSLIINGLADLDAAGNLLAAGTVVISGVADLDALGSLVAVGSIVINGVADLTSPGNNDISAVGSLVITGAALLTALGNMSAAGTLFISGVAELVDGNAAPGGSADDWLIRARRRGRR